MASIKTFNNIVTIVVKNQQLNQTVSAIANQVKQVSNQSINLPNAKKNITFSPMNEVRYFNKTDAPKTEKKTVYLNDIRQLKETVTTKLNEINCHISNIMTPNTTLNIKDIILLQNELNSLLSKVNVCQTRLNSSTYQHHRSKQATLSSLQSQLKITKHLLNMAEDKVLNLKNNAP